MTIIVSARYVRAIVHGLVLGTACALSPSMLVLVTVKETFGLNVDGKKAFDVLLITDKQAAQADDKVLGQPWQFAKNHAWCELYNAAQGGDITDICAELESRGYVTS